MTELEVTKSILEKIILEDVPFAVAMRNGFKKNNVANASRGNISALLGCELRHHFLLDNLIERYFDKPSFEDTVYLRFYVANRLFLHRYKSDEIYPLVIKTLPKDKDWKLIVYFDNKQYQDPIVYGDNIEYIPTEPMVADLLTLATNRSAAYIKSVTIYTTGSGSYSTSVQDTEDTVVCSGEGANGRMGEWTKVMKNGQLFIIKNGVTYNIFGTRVK